MPPNQGLLDEVAASKQEAGWEQNPDWRQQPPLASPVEQGKRILSRFGSMLLLLRRGAGRSASPNRELKRTAYLDGLRGFAAFLVYCQHHVLWAHNSKTQNNVFEHSWGTDGQYRFATFPGIRLLFIGGHLAVSTFFVISGYVLSTKPMNLIHSGETTRLGDNLASALFRRWLRLYIPLIVTTFTFTTIWSAMGVWLYGMKHEPTFRAEAWKWYAELKNFSFVFNMGGEPWFTYNPHLWSIPVEFKGSIAIYTTLMALSRASRNARLLCECALIFYFLYIADGWYCAMFVSGMLQCDLDLLAAKGELPSFIAALEPLKKIICYHLLAVGLYLGGVPADDSDVKHLRANKGWYYLSFLKPQAVFDYKWFFLFFAANIMVGTSARISPMKRFFETRFCQYLGRISYGLYLCHGPVLWLLGDRIYAAVGWAEEEERKNLAGWVDTFPLPKTGPMGLELAFLLPNLVLLPLTLWLAEMVTRFVDEPSVRFAQWLYAKTLPPPRPVKTGGGP